MDVLDTARRILTSEQRDGFRDRIVIGGLDEFLDTVRTTALPTLRADDRGRLLEVLDPLRGYSGAETRDRRAMLEAALEAIGRGAVQDRTSRDIERPHSMKPATPRDVADKPKPKRAPNGPAPAVAPQVSKTRLSAADLDTPIAQVPGVTSATAPKLQKLGIERARDLLFGFPFRHMDRSSFKPIDQLTPGQVETVMGTIWEAKTERRGGARTLTTAIVHDATGSVSATWFNQPYLAKTLHQHAEVVLSGKVDLFRGRPQFTSPDWELVTEDDLLHTGRLVPVYHLTEGLYQRTLRRLMKRAIDTYAPLLTDALPEDIRRTANLMGVQEAIAQYHFPDSEEARLLAQRRLAFDELFSIQIAVLQRRRQWQESQPGIAMPAPAGWLDAQSQRLPFQLTGAQRRVAESLIGDMASGQPMNRLVEGDVGSGKTVVAALAMQLAVQNGYQAVLMAPTEILAEQHFKSITALLDQLAGDAFASPRVTLLTGSVKGKARKDVLDGLANGMISVVIGTQALIQEGVELQRLGLAVVDEQHRFGVEQRSSIRQKGFNPHLLVMTATPIPRTLGLTLYGDLDISVIDEMPPGRQPIKTKWFPPDERRRAYEFMRGQVNAGQQAFVICPLVEESEKMEVRAATAEYERLQRLIFPELKLGLLHGRLKNREKEEVMARFGANEVQILVSTSVVEVGIDVPNATVMAIEGAERFGLAQLHQFRGRVGRSEHQSYCMLLSDSPAAEINPRLRAIEETQDGFRLAEIDLELRGYGDLFGTRQSGLPNLKVAKLTDVDLIQESRKLAGDLLTADPGLANHGALRDQIASFWHTAEVS